MKKQRPCQGKAILTKQRIYIHLKSYGKSILKRKHGKYEKAISQKRKYK